MAAQKAHSAPENIRGFLARAKPLFDEAGYIFKTYDVAWLKPEGALPDEYKKGESQVSEHVRRTWDFRGGTLAELKRGMLWVRLRVVGPNDSSLGFDLYTSQNQIVKLEAANPAVLDKMVELLDDMAAGKMRTALKLKRQFHLGEN